jgi:hypothetical protein
MKFFLQKHVLFYSITIYILNPTPAKTFTSNLFLKEVIFSSIKVIKLNFNF